MRLSECGINDLGINDWNEVEMNVDVDVDTIFGGDITRDEFDRWLSQFPSHVQPVAQKLALNFRYYSLRRMNEALKRLYAQVLEAAEVSEDRLKFIPVGYVAKSGSVIAYYFRKQNKLTEDRFLSSNHVAILERDRDIVPVLIDDFIGSGHQSLQVVNELRAAAPGFDGKVLIAAMVGLEAGIDLLRKDPKIVPIAADIVKSSDLPFAEPSKVFPKSSDRLAALDVMTQFGQRLYPQHPLGYSSSQGLIGFFYSTPNNTLPVFWSSEGGWAPLLPHGESFRDPSYLFGPPSGLSERLAERGPSRPFVESAELDNYDIPEEIAVKIFGEFHKAPIFLVLAPILRDLGTTPLGFASLLSAVSNLKHLEHEQHPVCSSLLVVKRADDLSSYGSPVVITAGEVTLDSGSELSSLAQLVDGLAGTVVATADGRVAGAVLYPSADYVLDPFLPARYHAAANTSQLSNGLCFVFFGSGRVQVFFSGQRILSYRNAAWHLQPRDLPRGLTALAKEHSIDVGVLDVVMRTALLLADRGNGTILTVGDDAAVIALGDPPNTGHMRFPVLRMGMVPDEMITGLMVQDGATIISAHGEIVQSMTFLRPPVGTEAEEEVGRGSKHSTAAKISKATQCIAIAVSVDGRVTVYGKGSIRFKMMG